MKKITEHWLNAAMDDLLAAKQLSSVEGLTNLVAFHAQQCIEKSMKALIEELALPNVKTHDLLRLYRLLQAEITISDAATLIDLNGLYTESRYPGDAGLLPGGKPTADEAMAFVTFADEVYSLFRDHLSVKFPN
jgi:HEPN domain-containing protein